MKPWTFDQWHAWTGTVGVLVSDESLKKLHQFNDTDEAVNFLWLNGHKDAARSLNQHVKGTK